MDEELENYYGTINEVKAGLTTNIPERPEILYYLEICEQNNLPLVSGGLLQQPHIFLLEANMARTKREIFTKPSGAPNAKSNQF